MKMINNVSDFYIMIWKLWLHTPWWVYIILYVCIKRGLAASKTRTMPLWKIFIIPVIFLAMSIRTLLSLFHLTPFVVTCYLAALFIGALLSWFLARRQTIEVDLKHKLLKTPGTWSTLIIVLFIFAAEYYFNYRIAMTPSLLDHHSFELKMLAVMGLTIGMFIGRSIYYLVKMYTQKSVDLRKSIK